MGRCNQKRNGRGNNKLLKDHQIKLFYANARGLSSKKLSVIDILGELKPEIALFSETMLKSQNTFRMFFVIFISRIYSPVHV